MKPFAAASTEAMSIFRCPFRPSRMRTVLSWAPRRLPETSAIASGARRKSPFSRARPSTGPRTCWPLCRRLSQSDTPEGLKDAIEGRIMALANVHALFVQSRWTGAELRSLVTQELSPYARDVETRTQVDGPTVLLEPDAAQTIAVTVHERGTTAARRGPLAAAEGVVQVEWPRAPDGLVVVRCPKPARPP